jgi:hypothetical protein
MSDSVAFPLDGYADKIAPTLAQPEYTIRKAGSITYYDGLIQGSDEWHAVRCGLLTASEMKLIVTPTLKPASNDKERGHLYELLAQRLTQYVEPRYIGDDMLRGKEDEIDALDLYSKNCEKVHSVGFITNNKWGFTLGYSPDGLVLDDGQVECKSRNQKYQVRTLVEYAMNDAIDPDFMIQVQAGLLVTERKWCDLVSYCGGLPMSVVRVLPDGKIQDAILAAAGEFEKRMSVANAKFRGVLVDENKRLYPTVRKIKQEMF